MSTGDVLWPIGELGCSSTELSSAYMGSTGARSCSCTDASPSPVVSSAPDSGMYRPPEIVSVLENLRNSSELFDRLGPLLVFEVTEAVRVGGVGSARAAIPAADEADPSVETEAF